MHISVLKSLIIALYKFYLWEISVRVEKKERMQTLASLWFDGHRQTINYPDVLFSVLAGFRGSV